MECCKTSLGTPLEGGSWLFYCYQRVKLEHESELSKFSWWNFRQVVRVQIAVFGPVRSDGLSGSPLEGAHLRIVFR